VHGLEWAIALFAFTKKVHVIGMSDEEDSTSVMGDVYKSDVWMILPPATALIRMCGLYSLTRAAAFE
jgi:hypothetical protein